MAVRVRRSRRSIVSLACLYDEVGDDTIEFNLPEDLSTVDDGELQGLLEQAQEAFDALDDDESISADTVETMTQLADAADAIRGEQTRRTEAAEEARQLAEEQRQRMRPAEASDEDEGEDSAEGDDSVELQGVEGETEEGADASAEESVERESVAAGAQRSGPIHVTLSGVRRQRREPEPGDGSPRLTLIAAADLPGHSTGSEISAGQTAQAFLDRMRSINVGTMRRTAQAGKRTVQSFSLASVRKHFSDDLIIRGDNDADEVLRHAADSSRLPDGSLTAAGWCSPSETLYELAEDAETTDGLFSLPEVQVDRGGLRHTLGPDFSSIFNNDDLSWNFTEDEIDDGDYDGYGGGSKPCFTVECPDFVEDRLDAAGICIRAGLLHERAYPETIERLVRGALVGHEFKQARRKLGVIEAGSTAVTMPADPVGTLAPTLQAVELQIEDYRQRHRIARTRMVELILPYWVRGAIRSDLSRRLGVDLLSISNEQINGWLQQRGANPQFVYELDDLTGDADARTSWPGEFKALIYLEGTWIAGTQAIITLESVFDSALVEKNVFTQLFTEEGWLVAKRFHDSRVVTVPICPDGHTAGGIAVECDGTVSNDT